MSKKVILIGTIFILFAIILGAFASHLLKESLTNNQLNSFQTGVRYQVYHGIALLVLGFNSHKIKNINSVLYLIFFGIILFSGSIYLLAIQDIIGISMSFLGLITPLGGLFMILAWVIFSIKIICS